MSDDQYGKYESERKIGKSLLSGALLEILAESSGFFDLCIRQILTTRIYLAVLQANLVEKARALLSMSPLPICAEGRLVH